MAMVPLWKNIYQKDADSHACDTVTQSLLDPLIVPDDALPTTPLHHPHTHAYKSTETIVRAVVKRQLELAHSEVSGLH